MSTLEMIEEKARSLPDDLQEEALHYVEYLLARLHAQVESNEWARFAGAQLARQYSPEDAIYD